MKTLVKKKNKKFLEIHNLDVITKELCDSIDYLTERIKKKDSDLFACYVKLQDENIELRQDMKKIKQILNLK